MGKEGTLVVGVLRSEPRHPIGFLVRLLCEEYIEVRVDHISELDARGRRGGHGLPRAMVSIIMLGGNNPWVSARGHHTPPRSGEPRTLPTAAIEHEDFESG